VSIKNELGFAILVELLDNTSGGTIVSMNQPKDKTLFRMK
jgi:hypothetical protein